MPYIQKPFAFLMSFLFLACTLRWPPVPSPVQIQVKPFPTPGVVVQVDLEDRPTLRERPPRSSREILAQASMPLHQTLILRMDPGIRWHPQMGTLTGPYFQLRLRGFVYSSATHRYSPWVLTGPGNLPETHQAYGTAEVFFDYLPPLPLVPPAPLFRYE